MTQSFPLSSHSLVRALRASSEPPQHSGPSKLAIARHVWDSQAFYVPNKAQLLTEWLLASFLDEASIDKPSDHSILLNASAWQLLADIVSVRDSYDVKAWLSSSLTQFPLAPIVGATILHLPRISESQREQLTAAVSCCLPIVWPLSLAKRSPETLLDCLGSLLTTLNKIEADKKLVQIGNIIATSFRSALGNAPNRKKLYLSFVQSLMDDWIRVTSAEDLAQVLRPLVENIYLAGTELIFCTQVLRQESSSLSFLAELRQNDVSVLSSLPVLPRLFSSFLRALRSSASSSTSTTDDSALPTPMTFYSSCQSLLDTLKDREEVWLARRALLRALANENVLGSGRAFDEHDALRASATISINLLTRQNSSLSDCTLSAATECLSILAEIDYALVEPHAPLILRRALFVRISNSHEYASCTHLLDCLLSYHAKSRSVPTYIESIFSSIALDDDISASFKNTQECYSVAFASPVFSSTHSETLSSNIHRFVTSGQVPTVLQSSLRKLNESWDKWASTEQDGPPQKRRKLKRQEAWDARGICFSLHANLLSIVLTSMPYHMVADESKRDIMASIEVFIQTISPATALDSTKKASWSSHIVASSLLRLFYGLVASRRLSLSISVNDTPLHDQLMTTASSAPALPELRVECFRLLLYGAYQDASDLTAVIELLVDYMAKTLSPEISWSGHSYELSTEQASGGKSALALMHMVFDRFTTVLESFATSSQLDRLAQMLLFADGLRISTAVEKELSPRSLLQKTLCSAHFWELPRLRASILSRLSRQTAILDHMQDDTSLDNYDVLLSTAISTYEILPLFPVEYLSKTCRTDLCGKAVIADTHICTLGQRRNSTTGNAQTSIRIFLRNVFESLGSVDFNVLSDAYVENVIFTVNAAPHDSSSYESATMGLIELYLRNLINTNKGNESAESSSAIKNICIRLHSSYSNLDLTGKSFAEKTTLLLINFLTKGYALAEFSPELQKSILGLHNAMYTNLTSALSSLTGDQSSTKHRQLLEAWGCCISFTHWMNCKHAHPMAFGSDLLSKALRQKDNLGFGMRSALLTILLEEYRCALSDGSLGRPESIITAYIALRRDVDPKENEIMDSSLATFISGLQAEEYSSLSTSMSEVLKFLDGEEEGSELLLCFSELMLQHSPTGTSKIVQQWTVDVLEAFINRDVCASGSASLHHRVLSLISRQCTQCAASLRFNEIACILSLLGRSVAPSRTHDGQTSPRIYQTIVNIMSTLMRQRRDLIVSVLPQLGLLLQRLVLALRRVTPNLGRQQNRMVSDSLPRWIALSQPLTSTEAKSLSRLFETLIAKTTIRNNSNVAQKAESLAKPFSKHAAYVLKAYVDSMNDVLCTVPLDIRTELQPGLFALCDMLSDHSRDALMVSSLDAGGKTILKALWKEYEAQKYVGRG